MDQKAIRAVIVAVVLLAVVGIGVYLYRAPHGEPTALNTGKQIYARNCAGCHGAQGTGNGAAAQYLFPKPRNFTDGVYKFTSTANGELPTDQDLIRVVNEGLSPGGMPGFEGTLTEQQVKKVVKYIKQFSPKFKNNKQPNPIQVPSPPEDLLTDKRIQSGREMYNNFGCASCHGPEARGNGPAADQQRDIWGEPVPPRDLSTGNFKAGEQPRDIYYRIATGINGTGMPPYQAAVQDKKQLWDLVAYVKSLGPSSQEESPPAAPPSGLRVRKVAPERTLKDPQSSVWGTADGVKMPLYSLWLVGSPVSDAVYLQALHNGQQIAFRLTWTDPTRNMKPARTETFTDAVGLMFPNWKGPVPFIGMGDATMDGGLADIWHWRAVDQLAVNRGYSIDVADAYPHMQIDYYKSADDDGRLTYPDPAGPEQQTTDQPRLFQPGWAVGNPLSQPAPTSPVKSYRARGFGTLTAIQSDSMTVNGKGIYRNGQWQVVLLRPMKTDTEVIQFEPGKSASVALAVWNGQDGDRNGQKDISSWITLNLEK